MWEDLPFQSNHSHGRFVCLLLALGFFFQPISGAAQDGAAYDPSAKKYQAPALSLAGAKDTPERTAAIGLLWRGEIDKALSALTQLAESGDAPSALLLGGLYRKSKLPIPVDKLKALHFYKLASSQGSGEGSERIAEMIEDKELPSQPEGDAAYWRRLAVKQGWIQQELAVYCYDWIHGPETLHCDTHPTPSDSLEQCPNDHEMATLREQGLTGHLQLSGGGLRFENGPHAKAILIVDRPVSTEQDLREPDKASVIYIETPENGWRMLPSNAPLLDRFLILTPSKERRNPMSIAVQDTDGSTTGSSCGPTDPLSSKPSQPPLAPRSPHP